MSTLPLTLFGATNPIVRPEFGPTRHELDPCCWVEHCPGFLLGADTLFAELEDGMRWERGRRLMYGTWYDEPRLTGTEPTLNTPLPPSVEHIRTALTRHYERAFDGLFCNYYETGQDSVAWHADRIGRSEVDPLVAIISLGGPRTFHLRPMGGGPSDRFVLHSGDLLVMGGATQHHWEHAVPKTNLAPPRMSVTMRAGGPRLGVGLPLSTT
ncbi:MAG: alpha-ketoglutarate-dependent dioxygenase AlkB [Acidimicrobiales bacterium]